MIKVQKNGGINMKNVGNLDRIIRIIIGLGILSLLFVLDGNAKFFGLIGIVPIATSALGFCPLYKLIGISTCSTEK